MARSVRAERKPLDRGVKRMPGTDLSERLIEAAIELFWAKGYADTNTRDIAEACGVSPGAMYFYYKSKAELLYRVLQVTHARMESAYLRALAEAGENPAHQLRALVAAGAWFHAAHREEGGVSHREFKFLDAPYQEPIRAGRRRMQSVFERVIQQGLDAGAFKIRGQAVRPARQLTIMVGNMINQIAEWYDADKDMSPEALSDFYAEAALAIVTADETPER